MKHRDISISFLPHLFLFEAMAQDVVHVLMQALKTPIAGPHIRVVGRQQPFNSRL